MDVQGGHAMGIDTEYPEPVVRRYPPAVCLAIIVSLAVLVWMLIWTLCIAIGPMGLFALAVSGSVLTIYTFLARGEIKSSAQT